VAIQPPTCVQSPPHPGPAARIPGARPRRWCRRPAPGSEPRPRSRPASRAPPGEQDAIAQIAHLAALNVLDADVLYSQAKARDRLSGGEHRPANSLRQ